MDNIEIKHCKGDVSNMKTIVVAAGDVTNAMNRLEKEGYTVLSTVETTAPIQELPTGLEVRVDALENRITELENNAAAAT